MAYEAPQASDSESWTIVTHRTHLFQGRHLAMDVVWLKRDARLRDHGPFSEILRGYSRTGSYTAPMDQGRSPNRPFIHPQPAPQHRHSLDAAPPLPPQATTASSSAPRPFLVLYMYEGDQLTHHSVHASHVSFVNEGLHCLDDKIRTLAEPGGDPGALSAAAERAAPTSHRRAFVTTKCGECTAILEALQRSHRGPIVRLLSHMEVGHNASFDRDKRVKQWCRRCA